MASKKVTFTNSKGEELQGILDLPIDQRPHNFVLFAHCFTCSKDYNTVVHISRSLAFSGVGVLRFDFTGLGTSEGEFSDTNFSGNVADLIAAADFLKENFQAPTLIIGHSLGGTAAIFAAAQIDSVKAIATIAAPADPAHVKKLIKSSEDEILQNGKATVTIEGRDFTIKKQFLDDLQNQSLKDILNEMRKAILIMHSPQDTIVDIDNAELIFKAAFHPKSFISLDGADHLLTRKTDARYVGESIAAWSKRYLEITESTEIETNSQVAVSLNHSDGYTANIISGKHSLIADEPERVGGNNFGPNPYDLLAASLGACTAMTVQMYARRKKWIVDNITVHIDHAKEHAVDCENCEKPDAKIDIFRKEVSLTGDLSEEQKHRLMEIADRCPVHRTLLGDVKIESKMIE